MSFEEEFDKIIRQKAEDANYPFDESHWEKTSRLLDAQQKVAKGIAYKKLAVSAFTLLLVGSASLGAWYVLSEKTTTNSDLKAALSTKQINKLPSQNYTPTPTTTEQNSIPLDSKNKLSPVSETDLKTVPGIEITSQKHLNPSKSTSNTPFEVKDNKTNLQPLLAKNEWHAATNSVVEKETSFENSGFPIEPKSIGMQETKLVNLGSKEVSNSVTSKPVNGQIIESAAKQPADVILTKIENIQPESIQLTNLEFTYTANEAELYPTPFLMLMRYDEDYFKGRRPKTSCLNAEAGSTYLLGWDTKAGKDGKGFDWYAGMNIGFYLNKRLNASIGIQSYNIKNINQAFYNSAKTEYGFGSTSSYTVVSSNNLYYVALPIKLAYAINSSNQIGLGLNVAYLFTSKNTVSTYTATEGPTNVSSIKTTGVYQGINTSNVLLSAFYKKQLSKRFNVNAEFIYGATDIFKNTVNIKNIEKPLGLRLSIQYTLFDK